MLFHVTFLIIASCNCCAASTSQGLLNGLLYGTIFGIACKSRFGGELYKVQALTPGIVACNVFRGAMMFSAFSTMFSSTSCLFSYLIPGDDMTPVSKGMGGYISTYGLAYCMSKSHGVAR